MFPQLVESSTYGARKEPNQCNSVERTLIFHKGRKNRAPKKAARNILLKGEITTQKKRKVTFS